MSGDTLLAAVVFAGALRRAFAVAATGRAAVARAVGGHSRVLGYVDGAGQLRQLRFVGGQRFEPLFGQFRSAADSFVPDDGEICSTAKVLSHGHGVVQIENHVPPTAGHEHSFAGFLMNFHL